MKKPEAVLVHRIVTLLQSEYPNTPYRFDLAADMVTTIGQAKKNKIINGKWSKGWPDLMIVGKKKVLFLELKATKKVLNSEHTRNQAAVHLKIRKKKHQCLFCCGFEECSKLIKEFLS